MNIQVCFHLYLDLMFQKIPSTILWILDSGATNHMMPCSKYFSVYSPNPNNKKIATLDGTCNIDWNWYIHSD
jgi:hypothetical protein